MQYNVEDLKNKIRELHPEIGEQGLNLEVESEGDRYRIKLSKAGEEAGAFLERQDADECLAGKKCVNLAVTITQLRAELQDLILPRKPG